MGGQVYRRDIDGLRAVAVLAVIAFHVDKDILPGGFAGVDVFFVISGFLITGIMARSVAAGSFSMLGFYARRMRRIYPALLVTIVTMLIIGWLLLLPDEYARLSRSTPWAAFGLSNFFFWSQTSYFAPLASSQPLLHTWSLGIEEQFYLVWPALFVAVARVTRRSQRALPLLAAAILVLSLCYCLTLSSSAPDTMFYSPLARAWELALGALVALAPPLTGRLASLAADIVGVLLVAAAFIAPRWAGDTSNLTTLLLACIGSGLLVMEKAPTATQHLTGLRPLVAIGKVSYSLYLWHWPLLYVLTHAYLKVFAAPVTRYAAYVAIAIGVSILSYFVVERPFRRLRAANGPAIAMGLIAALAVSAAGYTVTTSGGMPDRMPRAVARYASFDTPPAQRTDGANCFIFSGHDVSEFDEGACVRHDPSRPNVLILGDSHADQYVRALTTFYPEIQFSQVTASGCQPLVGATGETRCTTLMERAFARYLPEWKFDAVILSANWHLNDATLAKLPPTFELLSRLTPRIILLGQNPQYSDHLPVLLALSALRGQDLVQNAEARQLIRPTDAVFRRALTGTPATFYSVLDIICPQGTCQTTTPADEPMLHDDNHLSYPGAAFVVSALRTEGLFRDLLAR